MTGVASFKIAGVANHLTAEPRLPDIRTLVTSPIYKAVL